MVIGIRATVDFVFKLLLGSPEHTSITVHFLNAVLEVTPRIARVTITNPTIEGDVEGDKRIVLDIPAEDETGRKFNIEMQTSLPTGMSQRLAYYTSCLYTDEFKAGENYHDLRAAYCICVLETPMFPKHPKMHLDFRLRERDGTILTDDFQIHLVELSKCTATEHNLMLVSRLEKWAWFLRNAHLLETATLHRLLPEPEFQEAIGVLEMISHNPEQKRLYDARLKFQRDEEARIELARLEGKLLGEQIGQLRGEQIGQLRGEQIGQLRGEQIGKIRLLQELLGQPQTASEELAKADSTELQSMIEDLQRQLRDRHSN